MMKKVFERMLADGLTKQHSRQAFVVMLRGGILKLVEDCVAAKKDKHERAASAAKTFGQYGSGVAEKISMVILADLVRQADATRPTSLDEDSTSWLGWTGAVVTTVVAYLLYLLCLGAEYTQKMQSGMMSLLPMPWTLDVATQTGDHGADDGGLRAARDEAAAARLEVQEDLEALQDMSVKNQRADGSWHATCMARAGIFRQNVQHFATLSSDETMLALLREGD